MYNHYKVTILVYSSLFIKLNGYISLYHSDSIYSSLILYILMVQLFYTAVQSVHSIIASTLPHACSLYMY